MATSPPQSATLLGIPLEVRLIILRYNLPDWCRVCKKFREEVRKYIFNPTITSAEIVQYLQLTPRRRCREVLFIKNSYRFTLISQWTNYGLYIYCYGTFPSTSNEISICKTQSISADILSPGDINAILRDGYSILSPSILWGIYQQRNYLPLQHLSEVWKVFEEMKNGDRCVVLCIEMAHLLHLKFYPQDNVHLFITEVLTPAYQKIVGK